MWLALSTPPSPSGWYGLVASLRHPNNQFYSASESALQNNCLPLSDKSCTGHPHLLMYSSTSISAVPCAVNFPAAVSLGAALPINYGGYSASTPILMKGDRPASSIGGNAVPGFVVLCNMLQFDPEYEPRRYGRRA